MKKFLAIILSVLTLLCVGACVEKPKETKLQYGKKYSFYNITFERDPSIEFEDISSIIPNYNLGSNLPHVHTFAEFEEMLLNNLDKYKIVRDTPNGRQIVYFTIPMESVCFTEESVTVMLTDELIELDPELADGVIMPYQEVDGSYIVGNETFYYSKGKIMYKIMLIEGYYAVYNYK